LVIHVRSSLTIDTPNTDTYVVKGSSITLLAGGSVTPPARPSPAPAIVMESGTLLIRAGAVVAADATDDAVGAAGIVSCGISTVEGGAVSGGAGRDGGDALVVAAGALTMTGGAATGGRGTRGVGGMALRITGGGPFLITGGTLSGGPGAGGRPVALALGDATLDIRGGTFGPAEGLALLLGENATAVVRGGTFLGGWGLAHRGKVTVHGSGLQVSRGRLTGTLADGSLIDIPVSVGDRSSISFVQR
jgi:hypothetical protein